MNKNELASAVADHADLSKDEASKAVDAIFQTIEKELKNGNEVSILGFGKFSVSHRKARKGRNPQTGAEVDIAASNAPSFKAGKGLKDALN